MSMVRMMGDRLLQGGLLPAQAAVGPVVEIACDESGFSGTNLLHAASPVITHASVDLDRDEAIGLIAGLRSRFRCSPDELKSGRLLRRPGAGEALLTELAGRARVHLVDKEFFLVTRIVDLLVAEPSYAAGTRLTQGQRAAALDLHRAGRAAGGDWDVFLAAFVDLVRMKRRQPGRATLDRFFRARDALLRAGVVDPVLVALDPGRVGAVMTRLDDDDRAIPPPLEPMLPALAETVLTWSGGHRQVLVVHDEQSALTAGRLTRLQRALAGTGSLPDGVSPLAGLVMADSRHDPRVQVADLLAGLARRNRGLIDDAFPAAPVHSETPCLPELGRQGDLIG
ncbi:hypothetical protein Areg01_15130 [Actinoplanes regularis]|nr:hypothetical protein Areg01_15130 [Actinoplanes regularis]